MYVPENQFPAMPVSTGTVCFLGSPRNNVWFPLVQWRGRFILDVIQEMLFLKKLIQEQHQIELKQPIEIMEDNQGAIAFMKNNSNKGRSKHIDIRVFFVKDLIKSKTISIQYIPTETNFADIFTKPLQKIKYCNV